MTHPYMPMLPGSYIEYAACRFDGGVTLAGTIWMDGATCVPWIPPWASAPTFRMTCVVDQNSQIPMTMRVDTKTGHVPVPGMSYAGRSLYNGVWDGAGTPAFIGEYGGVGAVAQPPEPVLTMQPVAGEDFTVACNVVLYPPNVPSVQTGVLNCRYRTIWVGQAYGAALDTVLTVLEERYDTPGAEGNYVYQYVYQMGVGLIDAMWGRRLPGGAIVGGYQFYMVGHGNG